MDDEEEEEDEGSGAEERFPFERLKVSARSPPDRNDDAMEIPVLLCPPQTAFDEHSRVLVGFP